MKRIIIIGTCLVTAAIVYGFVDYLKTDKKRLQRMYGDEPAASAPPAAVVTTVANPEPPATAPAAFAEKAAARAPEKTNAVNVLNTAALKRPKRLNMKLYSRAALNEKYLVVLDSVAKAAPPAGKTTAAPAVAAAPAPLVVPVLVVRPAPVVGVAKKTFARPAKKAEEETFFKKLDPSLFSRAPLRKRKIFGMDSATGATTVMQAKN